MTYAFKDITVHMGGAPIVQQASSELAAGKITVIVGPNGAGKTTLLTALAGLRSSTGSMWAEGRELSRQERRSLAAYMPQDIGAQSSLTVLEVVLLGRLTSLGLRVPTDLQAKALNALHRFGLSPLQERTLDAVSGGQRQLVYLTQALFREPRLLLLDEPTAALDLRHQLIVMDAVRAHAAAHDIAVLIAIHDLSLAAQFADQVICLANGRIEADGPADQVLTADRLRALFGVDAEIDQAPSGHLRITPVRAVQERTV